MSYVIVRLMDDNEGETCIVDILSVEEGALIFSHRTDAEDFLDTADIDVEMHVIETPEGVIGVLVE